MRKIDLTGKKFGQWTVVKLSKRPSTPSLSKPLYWECQCSCGNIRIIPSHNLRCGRTKSCGHEKELLDYQAAYNRFVKSCEKREIDSSLEFSDFLEFTQIVKCHYCFKEIRWVKHGSRSSYNLDRKDNSMGYSKQNCVVCCGRCNFGKGDRYTYEEWFEMNRCFRESSI